MAYDNLRLEKGMYRQEGMNFTQVLESMDPSENYRGTALEGTDAFQRQLKRFGIRVKGAGSSPVEKFFRSMDSAVLFPEYIARAVRSGMEENDILPAITATTTVIDTMDYRSIYSEADEDSVGGKFIAEGARIPATQVKTKENLISLTKRGRMLVASYEAVRWRTRWMCWSTATAMTMPPRSSLWAAAPFPAPPGPWATISWWNSGASLIPTP